MKLPNVKDLLDRFVSHHQILPTGEILHRGIAEPPPVQEQYYGHDSSLQIPSRLPLMGCVFFMTGYTGNSKFKLNDKQRTSMERKMKRNGAEIEVTYSQRCTHVMTDSQDYQVVQQALKDGKRVVTIYWIEDILCSDPPGPMRPPWKANHLPMGGSHVAAQCKHYVSLFEMLFILLLNYFSPTCAAYKFFGLQHRRTGTAQGDQLLHRRKLYDLHHPEAYCACLQEVS